MAGNTRDRDVAMQAAEAALRDAERDIANTIPANGRVVTVALFDAVCTGALCTEGEPVLVNVDDTAKSAFLGQFTGELAIM
jgi:Tfp pilus assembly protein PilX